MVIQSKTMVIEDAPRAQPGRKSYSVSTIDTNGNYHYYDSVPPSYMRKLVKKAPEAVYFVFDDQESKFIDY